MEPQEPSRELMGKIDSVRSEMRALGRHPEIVKLAREDLERRIEQFQATEAGSEDRQALADRIEALKESMRELGRRPEVRSLAEKHLAELGPEGVTEKGPECNGCSVCLPCLVTPSPDMEVFLTTYSFNFKP
ncbi:MAG: hypothetical protein HYU64_16025 [Armatimonadetes bacterium]|nr:hypothetical protein [Armatimonadota bacterium]